MRQLQEVSVMTALWHPNVVLFMAACTKPPTMCMELMELGSLYDVRFTRLCLSIRVFIKNRSVSAGIVHRDLKSLNLLLDNKWNLKVTLDSPSSKPTHLAQAEKKIHTLIHLRHHPLERAGSARGIRQSRLRPGRCTHMALSS
jgi:hypothetical protein